MTDSPEQAPDTHGPENPGSEKSLNPAFSVSASPFNAIKLELAIILIIALLLWVVLHSITDNDLTHVAILFLYGITGAAWVVARIRYISKRNSKA